MTTSRRKFTPEEKARIVLEILKEEKSVSQLASEHGIHTNVLNRWKTEAIQNLPQLFVDDRKGITRMKNDYEQQINELYAEIGKLTSQLSWLKKKIWPLTCLVRNVSTFWNGIAPSTRSAFKPIC
ncbi:transposase [Ferviditalea candida]|uniref:Transposase n=1 Tax=Ferviditalea candida TaxID=3108399 RepID=A0ABU5ZJQ5_9BACL|nr:transposase [Paenibacillaceae bacterium T2]